MLIGAHSIIYSKKPEADRAFFREVLDLPNVDVGDGWLIFGLPPAEVAVHPSGENDLHEFYLMCDDVGALIEEMQERGIRCSPAQDQGYGVFTQVVLPGGGKLGIYQPRHARPKAVKAKESRRPVAARARKRTPARKRTTSGARKRRTGSRARS
jgi:hypothetical protein